MLKLCLPVLFFSPFLTLFISACNSSEQSRELPNILWLVSEDNSPMIGAYNDTFATTPNIDKFAEGGFLYTNAHANAPVCAPARNTIITGMYSPSNGNEHMRSNNRASEAVQFFPRLLREAGYYVTNNPKEDYNIAQDQTDGIWHESGDEAHYKNRAPGQPFFAVFNTMITHEISLFHEKAEDELRHNPSKVDLPPYHPDTPELRRQCAQYYDAVEDMDTWIGEKLRNLEDSGEAENTIVFYYADHGGVLPRSKRFVYETGTRVPLIVHIPEKFSHLWPLQETGSKINRPVSFVDLAPTILSLAGIPVPEIMQGRAFLGDQKTDVPEYVHMYRGRMDERYDMSRAVRNDRFRYIRNYMPYRMYGQHVDFLFLASGMQSWHETCERGDCNELQQRFWNTKPVEELYDTKNDPWEVNNLAQDADYSGVLQEMRAANRQWMIDIKDTGVIPEYDLLQLTGGESAYDYLRRKNINVEEWIDIADKAITATAGDIPFFKEQLTSDDSVKRYWAAVAFRILGEDGASEITDLKEAAGQEPSPFAKTILSETLYLMGEQEFAREELAGLLDHDTPMVREFALNAIENLNDNSELIQQAVIEMAKRTDGLRWENQDHRIVLNLLRNWGISPEEAGLKLDLGWIGTFTR
ncbi:MAG: sulfatase [Balneolaceae bacterium]|nr:MAG: sulfatase [Balneolaceae bacterium]